jgi:enamine deaminase RidA (YjgF/YER057c/UK114 family)
MLPIGSAGTLTCTSDEHELGLVSWRPDEGRSTDPEAARRAYAAMAELLAARGDVVLLERVLGSLEAVDDALEARAHIVGETEAMSTVWHEPTVVEGHPCAGRGLAGVQLITARPRGAGGHRLLDADGEAAGVEVEGTHGRYLALSDLVRTLPARDAELSFEAEAEQVLLHANRILSANGWRIGDVQRTWFYLNDILAWYDAFNRARNRAFDTLGLARDGTTLIPASTGISGVGHHGRSTVLDLLAIRGTPGTRCAVERLANPQQNEAPEYGSAFSRGLAVTIGPSRLLLVSGTASIDDAGRSTHEGDFAAQTRTTLDTVAALLGTAGAGLTDIGQATAFIKRPADVATFHRILTERGLDHLPIVCTIADVCRPELLFELDATAVLPSAPAPE